MQAPHRLWFLNLEQTQKMSPSKSKLSHSLMAKKEQAKDETRAVPLPQRDHVKGGPISAATQIRCYPALRVGQGSSQIVNKQDPHQDALFWYFLVESGGQGEGII